MLAVYRACRQRELDARSRAEADEESEAVVTSESSTDRQGEEEALEQGRERGGIVMEEGQRSGRAAGAQRNGGSGGSMRPAGASVEWKAGSAELRSHAESGRGEEEEEQKEAQGLGEDSVDGFVKSVASAGDIVVSKAASDGDERFGKGATVAGEQDGGEGLATVVDTLADIGSRLQATAGSQTPARALLANPTFIDALELLLRTQARERNRRAGRGGVDRQQLEEDLGDESIWLPEFVESVRVVASESGMREEDEEPGREGREAQAREERVEQERELLESERSKVRQELARVMEEVERERSREREREGERAMEREVERSQRARLERACAGRNRALALQVHVCEQRAVLAMVVAAWSRWKGMLHLRRTTEWARSDLRMI